MANILTAYPSDVPQFTSTSTTNWTIQGPGDYVAVIRQAEEDATITSVSGYHDLITGTPGTVRVGIQSLNTPFSTTVTFTAASTSCNGTFSGGTALTVGTPVSFSNSGGALPAAITAGTTYYVVSATTSVITISATYGGTAITFATAGTGTHTLSTLSGIPSRTWLGWADFTANTGNFPNFAAFKKTLTTNATLTRGQLYAIVFATNGGTWNSTNNMRFWSSIGASAGEAARVFPYTYGISNNATQAKSTSAITANAACSSSTKQYGFAGSNSNVTSWNSGSTPDERGVKFNLPTGSCTSFKVRGIRFLCGLTNSAATWDLVLYNSAGTVLQSTSFTNNQTYTTASILLRDFYFSNSTLATLTPNTDYRVVIKPTSASLGALQYNAFGSGWNITNSMVSGGTWSYTFRTDAGAWTDDPNTALPMKLLLEDVTSAGGGGGAIIPVGMSGGIRG